MPVVVPSGVGPCYRFTTEVLACAIACGLPLLLAGVFALSLAGALNDATIIGTGLAARRSGR